MFGTNLPIHKSTQTNKQKKIERERDTYLSYRSIPLTLFLLDQITWLLHCSYDLTSLCLAQANQCTNSRLRLYPPSKPHVSATPSLPLYDLIGRSSSPVPAYLAGSLVNWQNGLDPCAILRNTPASNTAVIHLLPILYFRVSNQLFSAN